MQPFLAALAGSATDPWVLALFALALCAWLESEVSGALAVFLPVACALAVAVALGALASAPGAAPQSGGPTRVALPASNAVASGAFVAYSLLVYGHRAWVAPAAVLAAAGIQVFGQGGTGMAAAGAAGGALLGAAAWLGAVLLLPRGRLARARRDRRAARDGPADA